MEQEQITISQIASDITFDAYQEIENQEVGTKEHSESLNTVFKGLHYISDEDKKTIEVEERAKDREIELEKIRSNERIRMAEIEANERAKAKDSKIGNIMTGIKIGVELLGIITKIYEVGSTLKNGREDRAFRLESDKNAMNFKSMCDKENREFLEDMNLKSYIFEESNSARCTASKRNEKLLDSFGKELSKYKN